MRPCIISRFKTRVPSARCFDSFLLQSPGSSATSWSPSWLRVYRRSGLYVLVSLRLGQSIPDLSGLTKLTILQIGECLDGAFGRGYVVLAPTLPSDVDECHGCGFVSCAEVLLSFIDDLSLMATGSIFVSALALPEEQSVAGGQSNLACITTSRLTALVTALFQTLVQLGGAFGLAVTTVISDSYQNKALAAGKSATDAILDGLHAAFWLGGGCSFIALILALVMLRGMGAIGNGVKESPGKEIKEQEALERRTVGEEKV